MNEKSDFPTRIINDFIDKKVLKNGLIHDVLKDEKDDLNES